MDACGIAPASVPNVITVGGSNLVGKFQAPLLQLGSPSGPDQLYSWSNTGECVDLFAPGVDIYAACGSAGEPRSITCMPLTVNCTSCLTYV